MNLPLAAAPTTPRSWLATDDGVPFPLLRATLQATASAGLARSSLTLLFRNPLLIPLGATCQVPLPADGAICGLALRIGEDRIPGEVLTCAAADRRYQAALEQGRTASVLAQEREGLFTQRLGNIPPEAEVELELSMDHPLLWLDEGAWEYRFPTVAPPHYPGPVSGLQARRPQPNYPASGPSLGSFELLIRDAPGDEAGVESPSHALSVRRRASATQVYSASGFALNQDLVVRWQVAHATPGLALARARLAQGPLGERAFGLLALTPPRGTAAYLPRDVTVLLDTSGSMAGPSLERAVDLASLLVRDLGPEDRLRLLAFSSSTEHWRAEPVLATPEATGEAQIWLRTRQADGATEMGEGLRQALRPLREDALTQVVLLTDGHVAFEREVWAELREHLPRRSRLHAVGVGSAPNRSLTRLLAQAGRGKELFIGHAEEAAQLAPRLLRALRAPLVTDLQLGGSALRAVLPGRAPDLFASDPALLSLELEPQGGELWVRGTTRAGPWEQGLVVPPTTPGEGSGGIVTSFGRRAVEELERSSPTLSECDAQVEQLSLLFQIASRRASWVVSTPGATVVPGSPNARLYPSPVRPLGLATQAVVASRPLIPLSRITPSMPALVRGPAPAAEPPQAKYRREVDPEELRLVAVPRRPKRSGSSPETMESERLLPGARVATGQTDTLVIEFELGEFGLTWARPASVRLELADGTQRTAAVLAEGSTISAQLRPRARIHLVLKTPADTPVRALLLTSALPLRIELET